MQRDQSKDQGIEVMESVGMLGTYLRKFLLKNGIILFAWGQAKFNLGDFDGDSSSKLSPFDLLGDDVDDFLQLIMVEHLKAMTAATTTP